PGPDRVRAARRADLARRRGGPHADRHERGRHLPGDAAEGGRRGVNAVAEEKKMNRIIKFVRGEDGKELIEDALVVGVISLVAVAALTLTGTNVNAIFQSIQAKLAAAA